MRYAKREELEAELDRHAKWVELTTLQNLPAALHGDELKSPRRLVDGFASSHHFPVSPEWLARIPEELPDVRSDELAGVRRIIDDADRFPDGGNPRSVFTLMVQWARSIAAGSDRSELDAELKKITEEEIGAFELSEFPETDRPIVFALARIQRSLSGSSRRLVRSAPGSSGRHCRAAADARRA